MLKFLKVVIPLLIVAGSAAVVFVTIHNMPKEQQPAMFRYAEEKLGVDTRGEVPMPPMFKFVEEKLKSIITPAPPIGILSPVRDLRGTWKSSLAGKGLQVYGKFSTGPGTTMVYEDGDIELVIDSVQNNIASGKIRYLNLCSYGQTSAPGIPTVTIPKQCTKDTGYSPMAIGVSGTRLDFGTVSSGGATFSMQGNYTTDIISGTMTSNIPPYGVLKGEFHLMRVQ
jgi:hypothetical protein